jgi:hypothetical protein
MKTLAEREAIALAVLTAPCELPSAVLADRVGLSRQLVRQIRIGDRYAEVLPHLPRIEPQAMQRSCLDCQLFLARPSRLRGDDGSDVRSFGSCSIDIPEAVNIHYARGCGAFVKG